MREVDINFTFQYGSIQINTPDIRKPFYFTLHSNMVLFKSVSEITLPCKIQSFTFQYGSIQINGISVLDAAAVNFTFQYGSIQIYTCMGCRSFLTPLHSNMVLFKSV